TLDQDRLQGATGAIRFERNSLNRRQYAVSGRRVEFGFRGVAAREKYAPGSTADSLQGLSRNHQWVKLGIYNEQYFT
ncbi:hypothetical protein NL496_29795, partial [Klebsiella pneumoniae]|nr:hypothetical protein [Klebsiella pneumoniae]